MIICAEDILYFAFVTWDGFKFFTIFLGIFVEDLCVSVFTNDVITTKKSMPLWLNNSLESLILSNEYKWRFCFVTAWSCSQEACSVSAQFLEGLFYLIETSINVQYSGGETNALWSVRAQNGTESLLLLK